MRVARWVAYGLLLAALCASAAAYVEDDDDDFGILEDHEEEAFVEGGFLEHFFTLLEPFISIPKA